MELKSATNMKSILPLILALCLLAGCSKDDAEPKGYTYYYPSDEAVLTAENIPGSTEAFDPKGIAVSNGKLYAANGNALEIFDALTFNHIKTIKEFVKGANAIPLTNLTSVCADNGRIYVGSTDSRLFVFDQATNAGISTVGNGNWWETFVHVFGVTVKDGLVFVKEKEKSIKVFDASQITETSGWNLKPIAKLNTLNGYTETYSMDVYGGYLVVAGRDAKSYLYYNITGIRANAAKSLDAPIEPEKTQFLDAKPAAVSFSTDWAVAAENAGSASYLKLYPKEDFIRKNYKAALSVSDILGKNAFGAISGTAQLNDLIFLSDNANKQIRIIRLHKSAIAEQN
ncbi:hypothetical protein LPB248_00465 [Flavobacterium sp. LPB0248]|uniref:PQQ-binding-like beta-propeller repeat protein n=1 Tax=Flavobacterium sp. LPB0248 TaxID=2614441 RepID=UPI0015A65537|nr:PQQ-binding-like beta-propeller repeat protein [Flavobacterium sp. LPB0248]QLC64802.1 hypothetical protein LPB248_00465 [Flavobacterium sp. LPB0248]